MAICDRCHKETLATIMSMFNTRVICMDCSDKERKRPDFKEAQDAEIEAIKSGNFNFPGIGYTG